MLSVVAILAAVGLLVSPSDWPSLTQKPFESRAIPDPVPGLPPLLVTPGSGRITTNEGWEAARSKLRDRWLKHLGTAPTALMALDVRTESVEQGNGYSRQLVSFASEGDDRLRAYLLVPDGLTPGERRAAVVVFHATASDTLRQPVGLGSRPDLALAVHLTRRGYVTLSPECALLRPAAKGGPIDWARAHAAALARRRPGWTGLGKMTFDASRCADFLVSLPMVDTARLGCIGHSLGAKEALYAMAFENRYRAGVANEGGVGLRMSNWFEPWYLGPGMKAHVPASEHHQLLALTAPRAILIGGGGSADGEASWPFVRAARPVYEQLGVADRVGLLDHRAGHTFPTEARRVAYRWLDHWLAHTPSRDEVGP